VAVAEVLVEVAVEVTAVESDLAYWGYRELLETQEQMVPEKSCKLVWSGRSRATTLSYSPLQYHSPSVTEYYNEKSPGFKTRAFN